MSATLPEGEALHLMKVLNNNVVLARDDGGQERILFGRGIGFSTGTCRLRADDPRVEKVFVLAGSEQGLQRLLQANAALVGTCAEILSLAARRLDRNFSGKVYEALTDHLIVALQRTRSGVEVPNPFLAEIQSLYPEEYQVAGEALEMLAERISTVLPEAEQGFLALHLATGRYGRSAKAIARHVAVVREVVDQVRQAAGIDGTGDSEAYESALARLTVHLHQTLMAASQGQTIRNPLLDQIRSGYPETFGVARRLADHMGDRIGHPVSDDLAGYLAVHILRLQALPGAG